MNPLTWHRHNEYWTWHILDLDDNFVEEFKGISNGSLKLDVAKEIRTGGSLTWSGAEKPDWLRMRVQPIYRATLIDGSSVEWKRGVYIPSAPVYQWDGTKVVAQVELYDKLVVLSEDKMDHSYSLAAGTVVTTAIRSLIESAGETRHAIFDSPETLPTAMVWSIGTTKLRIINDLLAAINYFSLWCDSAGFYRGEPYVIPQKRGSAWDFFDGNECIYEPDFEDDNDYFGVPNKVILVSQGDGDNEALVSIATNEDPDDPLSYPNRERWITVIETGVEATSQFILDELAERRLESLSQVASTITLKYALVPIDLNNLVNFRRVPAQLEFRGVVQEITIPCTSGKPATATIRRVK